MNDFERVVEACLGQAESVDAFSHWLEREVAIRIRVSRGDDVIGAVFEGNVDIAEGVCDQVQGRAAK